MPHTIFDCCSLCESSKVIRPHPIFSSHLALTHSCVRTSPQRFLHTCTWFVYHSFVALSFGESVHCPSARRVPFGRLAAQSPLATAPGDVRRKHHTHVCDDPMHLGRARIQQRARSPTHPHAQPHDPHVDEDRQREMFALLSDVRVCSPCGQPWSSSGRSTSGTARTKAWARASGRELYTSSSETKFQCRSRLPPKEFRLFWRKRVDNALRAGLSQEVLDMQ